MTPWCLNYLGGLWAEATQCMMAGGNGWHENHAAWNGGANDHWVLNNTPWSIGFYRQRDVPMQWALAEGWFVGDMYQESVVASTNPNRAAWISGSVDGSVNGSDSSPYLDNNETPGCGAGGVSYYPLRWTTAGELYERAGVSWAV